MDDAWHNLDRPLKILTLDGGGLQALSTLSILNDVCDAIVKSRRREPGMEGLVEKPAPCELFDIICGIGTGGWLALLLGLYRLDIMKCMAVYMEIADSIDSHVGSGRTFSRSQTQLDQKRLIAKIDQILERYEREPYLLDKKLDASQTSTENGSRRIRCRHAFAAAAIETPKKGGPRYEIFRTYRTKSSSAKWYHPGPNPAKCKVSAACAATGAAKYLLDPFTFGSTTFLDTEFPNPHNITNLAIDEAYHLFGEKPPISMILNIGPGIPTDNDIKKLSALSRTFSWPHITSIRSWRKQKAAQTSSPPISVASDIQEDQVPNRSDTTSSTGSASSLAREVERGHEKHIRERLRREYNEPRIYHRLGMPVHDDLSLNDVFFIGASNKAVDNFLADDMTKTLVQEAAQRYVCVA